MKIANLSSLNAHYVKRIGLIFASLFIALEVIAKLAGVIEEIDLRLYNLYIIVSLMAAVFSKEKVDDERSKIIRYFSLKSTFKLLILGIAINYCYELNLESIYIVISSLIVYLITYYLASYFNPEFIFKEETTKYRYGVKFYVGIMIFLGISLLITIIKTLIGF